MRSKRQIVYVVCLVGFALGMAANSNRAIAAESIAACDIWKSEAPTEIEKASSWLKSILTGFFQLHREGAQANPAAAKTELFFTDRSGFSAHPVCEKDSAPSRTNHLYYPMGIVVRKIGETELKGKFWLVETEYGLRTFIPESSLTRLRQDRVYFFANQAKVEKFYCVNQTDGRCVEAQYQQGRKLDPRTRYAAAERRDFDVLGGGQRNYIMPEKSWSCDTFKVGLYAGSNGAEPAPEDRGRLNTCENSSAKTGLDPSIKIVRHDDYVALFDKRIDGALLRVQNSILSKLAPEFLNTQKPCNATLVFENGIDTKLQGGAKINFAAVELGGSVSKSYISKLKTEYGPKVAIYFHAYDLVTEKKNARAEASLIQIRYACDDVASAPQTPREIRVAHPTLGDTGDFIIPIRGDDEKGDRNTTIVFPTKDRSELFNDGFVFYMEGAQDYFSIRDKIFGILYRYSYNKMQPFFENPDDRLYLTRTANFITHLILAATGKAPLTEAM